MKTIATTIAVIIALCFCVNLGYAQFYGPIAEVHLSKGVRYGAEGSLEEARNEFVKALEVSKYYTDAKICLSIVQSAIEKRIERPAAIKSFQGQVYRNEEKLDKAIETFNEALTINPKLAYAQSSIGVCYLLKRQTDKAISRFTQTLQIDPKYFAAYLGLSMAYLQKEMIDEAILQLKKGLSINPDFAEAHNSLAVAYYYLKQYALAIKHCDKAKALGFRVSRQLVDLLAPHRKQ